MSNQAPSATSALQRSMERRAAAPAPSRAPSLPSPKIDAIFWAFTALVLVAIAFGGGGVRYGLANLIVQLTALGLVAFYRDSFLAFWSRAPLALALLVGASLAVPILHLIPLPESVWTALPGRELAADARAAVGMSGWASLSLDSARTLVALSGLIAPLAALAIGWSVARDNLHLVGWAVVLMGLVNLVLGAGQVLSGEAVTSFYPENPMPGVLFGTFANRNSAGIFLVAALTLAALMPSPRAHPLMTPARVAACVLLLLAIVLTRSRTALAIAALPLILVGAKVALDRFTNRAGGGGKSLALLGAGGLVALVAIGSLLAIAPGRLGDTLDRFDQDGDPRSYIWEDALYASDRYWPAGAGMGTFDEVFQLDESLENMTQRRAGRAHNDYIEVAIEAGLPGLILIAGWLLVWLWLTWRARRSERRWMAWSGSVILLAVALQSITDYPLRNQSMLVVSAFALLLLVRCGARGSDTEGAAS